MENIKNLYKIYLKSLNRPQKFLPFLKTNYFVSFYRQKQNSTIFCLHIHKITTIEKPNV